MSWQELLRRWALSDRVRASPREGKLLRLRVGACVRVGETLARVTRRVTECSGSGGSELTYTCSSAAGDLHLCVSLPASDTPLVRVRIREDGRTRDVSVHDIETFG